MEFFQITDYSLRTSDSNIRGSFYMHIIVGRLVYKIRLGINFIRSADVFIPNLTELSFGSDGDIYSDFDKFIASNHSALYNNIDSDKPLLLELLVDYFESDKIQKAVSAFNSIHPFSY